MCSAPAILVLLWIHVQSRRRLFYITVGASVALWVLQKLLWLIFLARRNAGLAAANNLEVIMQDSRSLTVAIHLQKPFRAIPGHYIYITVPGVRSYGLGYLESHPFYIAETYLPRLPESMGRRNNLLVEQNVLGVHLESLHVRNQVPDIWNHYEDDSLVVLHLTVSNGFTKKLLRCMRNGLPVIIDGPYGKQPPLDRFDTVLFLASGVGLAAQLLHLRHLLEAHNSKTARARRITLVWFLQTNNQYEWAQKYLEKARKLDDRDILNIHICEEGDAILDIGTFLEAESAAEAGNMAIFRKSTQLRLCHTNLPSVCGPPSFEAAARKALVASRRDISLFTSSFQPDN